MQRYTGIAGKAGPRSVVLMSQDTEQALTEFLTGRVCVLGFGNRLWRDEGAGSILAEALAAAPGVDSVDGGLVPENYLETVAANRPDTILLIDAADFGGQPGEIRLLAPGELLAAGVSTHAGSPRMLADYLQRRTRAPVVLLAVQPGDTSEGSTLSRPVSEAVSYLLRILPGLCGGPER